MYEINAGRDNEGTGLVEMVSDKVLSGVVALDVAFGDSPVACVDGALENSLNGSLLGPIMFCSGLGLTLSATLCCPEKLSARRISVAFGGAVLSAASMVYEMML